MASQTIAQHNIDEAEGNMRIQMLNNPTAVETAGKALRAKLQKQG